MGDIVVITGGSGCLAQHLIRELQTNYSSKLKEIRVVDKQLFRKFLEYPDNVPVVEFIADCAEESEIVDSFKDASFIFHMAARPYNFDMYPNKKGFWRDNVKATETVIAAAKRCNVPFLVYTSDAMAGVGIEDSQGMSELAIGDGPKRSILGHYGRTKFEGQHLIKAANGTSLDNGNKLHTVVISPSALYGEGDNWFLPHMARICRQYGGTLQQFGDGVSVLAWTYAGNSAQLHLVAMEQLRQRPEVVGGEVFIGSENTVPENYFTFIRPFVEAIGFKMSSFSIPYLLGFIVLFLIEMFFSFFFLVFGVKFPHQLPSSSMERIAGGYYFHFNTAKARLVLDYKPKYQPEKAKQATLDWWCKNYKNC